MTYLPQTHDQLIQAIHRWIDRLEGVGTRELAGTYTTLPGDDRTHFTSDALQCLGWRLTKLGRDVEEMECILDRERLV